MQHCLQYYGYLFFIAENHGKNLLTVNHFPNRAVGADKVGLADEVVKRLGPDEIGERLRVHYL